MILATTSVTTAEEIYSMWNTHKVLKDYKRPGKSVIEVWVKEIATEERKIKK